MMSCNDDSAPAGGVRRARASVRVWALRHLRSFISVPTAIARHFLGRMVSRRVIFIVGLLVGFNS